MGATSLRRLGKSAMVFGVVAGTSLDVFAAGRLLADALPGVFMYENFFRLLLAAGVICCASGGTWAVILCVALVRQALRSPRAVG